MLMETFLQGRGISLMLVLTCLGCSASREWQTSARVESNEQKQTVSHTELEPPPAPEPPTDDVELANHEQLAPPDAPPAGEMTFSAIQSEDLASLVASALAANPRLQQLRHEADAAWEKMRYADALPDTQVGTNIFGRPIETAAGAQHANLTVSQMIPWLHRLEAQEQQAAYEAMALEQLWRAEQLKTVAKVKSSYYRLYVIGQELLANESNTELVKRLTSTATSQIQTGVASQGDVLLGTLALSRLEESRVMLEQRLTTTKAGLNQLLDRPADSPLEVPHSLAVDYQPWSYDELRQLAENRQPEIAAAYLRAHASRWGVEVAALRRFPDMSLNFSWYFIGDNRPLTSVVDVGADAWSLGTTVTLPLWHGKNEAIRAEAVRRHFATHAAADDIVNRYDAMLLDLLAQAQAADEISRLYKETMLNQAQQTLDADLASYPQGRVEFDRVVDDARNLLTLQVGYHQALGRLAETIARLEQVVATELTTIPAAEAPPPAPL